MTASVRTASPERVMPLRRIGREIDLPWPTAVWVLTVHILTILSPILVIVVVSANRAYLDGVLDRPELLYVSAVLLIIASVCESAQNTLDRWYLIGTPPTLLDFLFQSLVMLALAVNIIAVEGDRAWVWWLALGGAAAFALAYLMGWPTPPLQTVLGVASAYLLYRALDQPVVILGLITVYLTLYFLHILLRTQQQVMHGFVTGINAVGLMATVIAIVWSANDEGMSWPLVIAIALIVVGATMSLRPALLRLPATPHKQASVN